MAKINLLPWREELRQERQRKFAMSALFSNAIVSLVSFGNTVMPMLAVVETCRGPT